jgi:ribosome assembly protein SQT1
MQGHQVAPAELEAHLLAHPFVEDCAVIAIPDDFAGEAPKAYIVKSKNINPENSDKTIEDAIISFVKGHKTRYKWIKEIEFVEIVPKSPSGKILRRILRDSDRAKRKQLSRAKL